MNKYSDLLAQNALYQKRAKFLLSRTGLLDFLGKYGRVEVCGSYAAGLMMHGDIDIKVVGKRVYASKDVLRLLGALYTEGKFRSYFIGGDWNDPRLGREFPRGRYIGLKTKVVDETWKIDIWLIDEKEASRLRKGLDVCQMRISPDEKSQILKLKKERRDKGLRISSQDIYRQVLRK